MNFFQVKRAGKRTGNMNPLLIPSIVHRTVQYLSFKELLACRQVNKVWREEATKVLLIRDRAIVVVPDWPSIEQFVRVAVAHKKAFPSDNIFTAVRLGPHISLADKSNQLAIEKLAFQVKHLELHLNVGPLEWRWLLFDQFVNLRELHFFGPVPFQPILSAPVPDTGGSSPMSSSSKAQLVQQGKIKELVNLTRLVFNLTNRKSEDIFVRRFLRDMFAITPNLESLEWVKEDRFANDFQRTMFDCLMLKTKPGSMGHLEIFNCPSLICGTKELRDMGSRGFPLREIHIQIASDVSAQYLENFLEAHGGTLEKVHLDFCPGSPLNVMVNAPISGLAHLRELALTEYRRSIGFVGYLPSLKKLTLTRTNIKRALLSIGWAFENKEQKELSKSLQELYVYNDYLSREQGNCTREIVLKLAHCFPNLRAIRMEGLDDSSIRHLFKSFANLEELYAPSGTYSDEAFRSYICKEQLLNSVGRSPNRYILSAFDASHLKNLRTLELESIGLTDKFVTHGIINWRSLRNLSVKYCRMSFMVLARMLMEMDLHQLRLHQCTIHTQGIFGVSDDPVDLTQEDGMLNLSHNMIHKWRFETFRLLFVQAT